MKAFLRDRVYVPVDWLEEHPRQQQILSSFTYTFTRRHHTYAQKGQKYKETIRTYARGKKYVRFERGDYEKVKSFFKTLRLKDQRVTLPFGDDFPDLKFTSTLREEQKGAVDEWLKAKHGIIKAPTRWGKMVAMVYIAVAMGERFLGIAHTKELRDQMEEEFRKHTNINEIEAAFGRPLIGVYDYDDGSKRPTYPIATFATYQSFLSGKGKSALEKLKKRFGLVWVTESHLTPAKCFSNVLADFWSKYKGGDTATPNRKDGTEVVMFDVLGPITAHGTTEQMDCDVVLNYTGMFVPERLDNWSRLINKLSKDDDRNLTIIEKIIEDVEDGRHVLVLTERVQHTIYLANYLSQEGYTAKAVFGALKQNKREEVWELAKSGELQVVVSVAKIVQHGITVKPWDCVHLTMPSNNKATVEQRVGRVRTPSPGKRKPLIRDWIDRDDNPLILYTAKTRRGVYEALGFDITSEIPESLQRFSSLGVAKGTKDPP